MASPWGRIAPDGTVFVRTTDGERTIGSWQAGTTEEGLAFYTRRYDDLAAEVALLEARAASPASDIKAVGQATRRLAASLPEAAAIGDFGALERRLAEVLQVLDERVAAKAAARARAAEAAVEAKRALVEEATRLADSNGWRETGDRFRAIVEEWKAIHGVDRRTDSELWGQFAAARRSFDARRRAHFAELEQQRTGAAERKEALIREAEQLVDSTDWTPTAKRFRDLMSEWKRAGHAARPVDEELWRRFKTAQDAFFAHRAEAYATRDATIATHVQAKEALIAEAEALDAAADPDGARKRLRSIHDRWEKVGHIPREKVTRLEERLAAAERRIRETRAAVRQVEIPESPLVVRLRESVTKLEARLERANSAGDRDLASQTEAALTTQREWLSQAESSA